MVKKKIGFLNDEVIEEVEKKEISTDAYINELYRIIDRLLQEGRNIKELTIKVDYTGKRTANLKHF